MYAPQGSPAVFSFCLSVLYHNRVCEGGSAASLHHSGAWPPPQIPGASFGCSLFQAVSAEAPALRVSAAPMGRDHGYTAPQDSRRRHTAVGTPARRTTLSRFSEPAMPQEEAAAKLSFCSSLPVPVFPYSRLKNPVSHGSAVPALQTNAPIPQACSNARSCPPEANAEHPHQRHSQSGR